MPKTELERRLKELFFQLVKLDGPSRFERSVADFVRKTLESAGYTVEEDDTGALLGGNAGNLLAFPPHFDASAPAMMCVAHMDTVRSTADVEPVEIEGRLTNRKRTPIGADDRAGVTVLLSAARTLSSGELPPANVVFAFTVGEEIGPDAAQNLRIPANVAMAYIFDSSARPGAFIESTFGAIEFRLRVKGKAAHAGLSPETGINAIVVASWIIAGLHWGKVRDGLRTNVGKISGGGMLNVVPDFAEVAGQVRGSTEGDIRGFMEEFQNKIRAVCAQEGAKYSLKEQYVFRPYHLDPEWPVYRLLIQTFQELGLEPRPLHYAGGSDANVFNEKGLPTINVGIGAQNPHSPDEFILLEDLVRAYEIALGLVRNFARSPW